MMRSSNPAFWGNTFSSERSLTANEGSMTIQGTVNKTLILLACVLATASWVWMKLMPTTTSATFGETVVTTTQSGNIQGILIFGFVGSIIAALVTIFNKKASPISAPIYALCEGLLLGGISAMFQMQYPGIVTQAVALTFGTLFCLLMVYKSGLIKVTENFKMGLFAATGAVFLVYLVDMVMHFFNSSITMIYGGGMIGIAFSLIVVTIAALNLVMDFDFIEQGSHAGAPKYMEWYGAFGLMVTLIWLYMEILRLLAKINSRR